MAGSAASADTAGPSHSRRQTRPSTRLTSSGAASTQPQDPQNQENDDRLDRAVAALQQDLDDFHTGKRVTGLWAAVIDEYCRRRGFSPFDFGTWALHNLGSEAVLTILRTEFGVDTLEDTYNTRRKDSASRNLSEYLGLPSAHLLALWFGADTVRTPDDRTISILRTAISSEEAGDSSAETVSAERKAQNLSRFVRTCKPAFQRWATRLGIQISTPLSKDAANKKTANLLVTARACCIWASRSTLSGLSNDRRRMAKLCLSDFQLSREGKADNGNAGRQPQSPAMGNTLTAKRAAAGGGGSESRQPVEDNNNTSTSSFGREDRDLAVLDDPGFPSIVVSQVVVSSSNSASPARKENGVDKVNSSFHNAQSTPVPAADDEEDDGKGAHSPITGREPKKANLPAPATQPALSRHPRHPGEPQGPWTSVGASDTDTPSTMKRSDSSSSESVFDDKPLGSHRSNLQTQITEFDMCDAAPWKPLKRQRHDSTTGVLASPSRKKVSFGEAATKRQQRDQQTESASPAKDGQGKTTPTPEGGHREHHLQDMHDIMVLRLKDHQGWLGGETVHYFIQLAAFSHRSHTTAASLMFKAARAKDSAEDPGVSSLLVDVETGKPVEKALLGLNIRDNHWFAALLDVPEWTITVYDSLPGPCSGKPSDTKKMDEVRRSVAETLSVLQPSLSGPGRAPECSPEIVFSPTSALQSDGHNCGVFAIVNAFFLAAGLTPPARLDGGVWRSILLAKVTGVSIASVVQWLSPIDRHALADGLQRQVEEEIPLIFTTMGELVECTARRNRRMRYLRLKTARDLEDGLDLTMVWLRDKVVRVLSGLERAATAEASRLKEVLETMGSAAAQARLARPEVRLAGLHRIYDSALDAAAKQADRLRRVQKLRLDRAESCIRAVRALDLQGAIQSLETAKALAQQEIREAVEDMRRKGLATRSVSRLV